MLNLKNVIGATIMATAAFAGTASVSATDLTGWAQNAAEAVDAKMTYPTMAMNRNHEGGATLKVTVNRDGDLIASKVISRVGRSSLTSAARSLVKRADFPALPRDFAGNQLTFALKLSYGIAATQTESYKMKHFGTVSTEELASSSNGPLSASVSILTSSGE